MPSATLAFCNAPRTTRKLQQSVMPKVGPGLWSLHVDYLTALEAMRRSRCKACGTAAVAFADACMSTSAGSKTDRSKNLRTLQISCGVGSKPCISRCRITAMSCTSSSNSAGVIHERRFALAAQADCTTLANRSAKLRCSASPGTPNVD